MLTSNQLEQIEQAIELGWQLRPVVFSKNSYQFVNKNDEYGKRLADPDQVLKHVDDLKLFPRHKAITTVSLVSPLHKNFVCLDFDTKEDKLKKLIRSYLKKAFKKEDLFYRQAHKEKLGQFWFQCPDFVQYMTTPHLDIITTQWRCDAIGQYKDKAGQSYVWPFRKIYEDGPDLLPTISLEQINELKAIVSEYVGEDISDNTTPQGRHGAMLQFVNKRIMRGDHPDDVYLEIRDTDEYIDAFSERPNVIEKEVIRMISGAVRLRQESGIIERDLPITDAFSDFNGKPLLEYPTVEKSSFIDILTRAIRRNQFKNSKRIAFFSALSVASWICSFSVRFGRLAPNLMILYVAKSGAGKSDSGKIVRELQKVYPLLSQSVSENINSTAQLAMSISQGPNHLFIINEYSSISKRTETNSYMTDIPEKMMQYYNDYCDDDVSYETLKDSSYGVCLGPKLNALLFTSPTKFNVMEESAFEGGLGRRTFTVVDNNTYLLRRNRPNTTEYFTKNEIAKIKQFFDKTIFPKDDDEDWTEIYKVEDISNHRIISSINKAKNETKYYNSAKAPNIIHYLKLASDVELYLSTVHIDKINRMIKQASKTANKKKEVIANSYGEFVMKLAMIHTIAGKKTSSFIIEMDSIKWAEDMVNFYLDQDLTLDLENIFHESDKEASYILKYTKKFKEKLIENKVEKFSFSHPVCLSFFQAKRRKYRTEILNVLRLEGFISLENEDATKRSQTFKCCFEGKH